MTTYNLDSVEEWEIAFAFIKSKKLLREFDSFRKKQLDIKLKLFIKSAESQHENSVEEFNKMMANLLGDEDE